MERFSHVDKINLSNIGIFEFDFWKLKIDGRQCHLQPLMLINDANAIFCHCHPKWKLKITYDQPIKVHHPFSSQPIISLKLGNFLAFKKLPGKFIRSRPSNHSFAEVEKMGGNEGQFRNRKRTTEGGQSNYKATGDLRGTEITFYNL